MTRQNAMGVFSMPHRANRWFAISSCRYRRMSFMYEQEVRAVLQETAPSETYASVSDTGIYVPCHVDNLIERVFVAPTTPDFFREGVQRAVDFFGPNRQVALISGCASRGTNGEVTAARHVAASIRVSYTLTTSRLVMHLSTRSCLHASQQREGQQDQQ